MCAKFNVHNLCICFLAALKPKTKKTKNDPLKTKNEVEMLQGKVQIHQRENHKCTFLSLVLFYYSTLLSIYGLIFLHGNCLCHSPRNSFFVSLSLPLSQFQIFITLAIERQLFLRDSYVSTVHCSDNTVLHECTNQLLNSLIFPILVFFFRLKFIHLIHGHERQLRYENIQKFILWTHTTRFSTTMKKKERRKRQN